jgi:TATA-binding protein-associated factor Taf7
MTVERTDTEIIIRLPASVDIEDLQDMLNYTRYKELTTKINVEQAVVDKLATQINADWWAKNKDRLLK